MDRVRWSQKDMSLRSLVDDSTIQKPALVRIGSKAIVVGKKINGEFIMASPCKVSGDRFDVLEQEIILSSKHTGLWRVISRATPRKEDHIHRLSTKDLERIYQQDLQHERQTPRSYICIRDIEAFELIVRNNDPAIADGSRIERRMKPIEENIEFEIIDAGEVKYTPSESELTSQDYIKVARSKQSTFLQFLVPGLNIEDYLIRNRAVRALYCVTKGETRRRHFFLEVNEQPCEIRPIAFEGSTELRYLHSTQNLYDYMSSYGNDAVLYVKLLRGDPPIKAIEFDGYLVLKTILQGDRLPICRVEDLEITLVSPDLNVRVRIPSRADDVWHSLSEVRAAEIQCMQLRLALLDRHESEMYVTIEEEKKDEQPVTSDYNDEQRTFRSQQSSDIVQKHLEECQKVFGTTQNSSSRRMRASSSGGSSSSSAATRTYPRGTNTRSHVSSSKRDDRPAIHATKSVTSEPDDYYNRFHRTTIKENPLVTNILSSSSSTSSSSKNKTNGH